jgi:hypothetical protein
MASDQWPQADCLAGGNPADYRPDPGVSPASGLGLARAWGNSAQRAMTLVTKSLHFAQGLRPARGLRWLAVAESVWHG